MKAIETIRWALRTADDLASKLAGDLRDEPLARSTRRGNHAMWVLGHLAVIEGALPHVVSGEPNPVQHWQSLFGAGSKPTDAAEEYPPFEDVFATYRELRAKNLARLEEIGEEGLDRAPSVIPPGFEEGMKTIGRTYHLVAMHQMFHLGQVAEARRAAGREPFI